MDKLVSSFVNYTFAIGEWLISKKALTKNIIRDMEGEIIIGIPCLAVLNCIAFSSQFSDGNIHLATGEVIPLNQQKGEPQREDVFKREDVLKLLKTLVKGEQIYRKIEFNYDSYDAFKLIVMKQTSYDNNDNNFQNTLEHELYKILYGISLGITQIKEYKDNYSNVIGLLESICDDEENEYDNK